MRFWKYVKGINYKNGNNVSSDASNEDKNSQLEISDKANSKLNNDQKNNSEEFYDSDKSFDNDELHQQEDSISEMNSEQTSASDSHENSDNACEDMSQEKDSSSELSEPNQQGENSNDMQESITDASRSELMENLPGSQEVSESTNDSKESNNNSQKQSQELCMEQKNSVCSIEEDMSQEKDSSSEPSEPNQQGENSNDTQESITDASRSESMENSLGSQETSESTNDSKESNNSQKQSQESKDEQASSNTSNDTLNVSELEEQNKSNSQTNEDASLSESSMEEDLEFQEYDQDKREKLDSENVEKTLPDKKSTENKKSPETEKQELSSQNSNSTDKDDTSLESDLNNEEENKKRLELLKKLRDKIAEYATEKENKEKPERHKNHAENKEVEESVEEDYQLSEETNQFIDKLKDLPSFENRNRGPGYAIDTETFTDVPESIIRTLITKFLNQRFCKRDTDLNVRSNSLEKSRGFYKWEVKDVVIHLETEQLTKIPNDKYGYQYANGKNETVPLSFYFDMSGSMSEYTNMLAVIAIELLKKGVKVLIGFNERVRIQIDSINKNITVEELARFLEKNGYDESMQSKVKHKSIDRNIDNYLIEAKAEKCCVFSDFDPKKEVINLSHKTQVYWFCFENEYYIENITNYNGFVYPVHDIDTIAAGLVKVNENRFETLLYVENPKKLRR